MPLIICVPGMKPGRTSSLVELVDFYPTCTDLLGLPTPKTVQGKSLMPILRDPKATLRDTALSINLRGPGGALRGSNWAYISYGEGKGEELYDMANDPKQFTNLLASRMRLDASPVAEHGKPLDASRRILRT